MQFSITPQLDYIYLEEMPLMFITENPKGFTSSTARLCM